MQKAAPTSEGQLLNIKQAALMLNVSEVSLRRWTDSGKLPCLRIGPKRERRFQRGDLLAFLEGHPGTAPVVETEPRGAKATQVLLERIAIDYGSHLCAFYESDLGRVRLAVPFLAGGLRAGDICYLIGAADTQRDILHHLGDVYDSLGQAIEEGRLIVCEGMESGRSMYEFLERNFVMATRSGRRSLRVLGDMAWFRHKGMDIAELNEFEIRYNHSLAHQFPVVALCQYDVREFSGKAVLDALKCHEDTFHYPLQRFLGV